VGFERERVKGHAREQVQGRMQKAYETEGGI
jgi:hypothetical protein